MKTLYYPCCGDDSIEIFEMFKDRCDRFVFCDLGFSNSIIKKFEKLGAVRKKGMFKGNVRYTKFGYREISPSKVYLTIDNKEIILRKGFGQFGLFEFEDNSIDVFVHRGDSCGEGGSCIYFFENKKMRYEKLSNLFDVLYKKLKKDALVVTDGSNIGKGFEELRRFFRDIKISKRNENIIVTKKYEFFVKEKFNFRYNLTIGFNVEEKK